MDNETENYALAALRLTGERPGTYGRLRTARIIMGLPTGDAATTGLLKYQAEAEGWPLRDVVSLIDALTEAGLLTSTQGARPTLVLTRAGHRSLDALELHESYREGEAMHRAEAGSVH